MDAELEIKFYHDHLTGIANRFALMEHFKKAKDISIFLLNIDNFGNINNAYGFRIGDKALVEIVKLLKLCKPSNCELFRFDSDEFVLVCPSHLKSDELGDIADSILSFFDQSEIIIDDDIELKISFSIGIATGSSLSVLNHAKVAIEELRVHKRSSYNIFDASSKFLMKQQENVYWIHKIKEALVEEELFAYFQPIVNNKTKKIEKFECLVRIFDDGILIPPIRFMGASKLTGTLSNVTKSIIEQSFKKFSNTEYEFSINITSDDLYMHYLESYLLSHVQKYNINPSRVVLEILEDIASLNDGSILEQLDSLRFNGFKIAIDDFGSESSNFSRLLEFSPDYLKIDGSFIKNILEDEKSQIIVEAIVLICKKSNIKIIAEYVHSKEVQEKIVELGIDYSQGYYFGEPSLDLPTL